MNNLIKYSLESLSIDGINNGLFKKPTEYGVGVPLINVSDTYRSLDVKINDLEKVNASDKELERFSAKEGDLFFVRSSLKKEGIGQCCFLKECKKPSVFECHLMRVRPNQNIVYPQYLAYLCSSYEVRKPIMQNSQTTTMTTLPQGGLGKIFVAIPPIPTQKKIVNILNVWDKAIDQIDQLIKAKEKQKKALMQQLLTGKRRFKEFIKTPKYSKSKFFEYPGDWLYCNVGSVATEVKKRNNTGKDIHVLSCTKYDGLVDSLEYFGKRVFSDDTSNYKVVRRGQFAYATNHIEEGSIGLLEFHKKGLVSPMYTVFKTDDRVYVPFLYKVFKTELYRHIFAVNTNASVNRRGSLRWKGFAKIKVALPSFDEQKKISGCLDVFDKEIRFLKNQVDLFQKQKKGLMQKLLTGKIRVKI